MIPLFVSELPYSGFIHPSSRRGAGEGSMIPLFLSFFFFFFFAAAAAIHLPVNGGVYLAYMRSWCRVTREHVCFVCLRPLTTFF